VHLYMTYCCRQKHFSILPQTPEKLYISKRIKQFFDFVKANNLPFAVFSDKYGVVFSNEKIMWYDVPPGKVRNRTKLFTRALTELRRRGISKICFWAPAPLEPLYKEFIKELRNTFPVCVRKELVVFKEDKGRR